MSHYRSPLQLITVGVPGATSSVIFPGEGGFEQHAIVRYSFEDRVEVEVSSAWHPAIEESALEAGLPHRSDDAFYRPACSFRFVTIAATVSCSPSRNFSRVTWWWRNGFMFTVGVRASTEVTPERAIEAVETITGALMTKSQSHSDK